jgi:hypothetical protein
MGQSNQRLRDNTYENLQNMMLERQDASAANDFGMSNTPGMSGENPMNSMLGAEGENKGGMAGTGMNETDIGNNMNAMLGDQGENTDGMVQGMDMDMGMEEEAEGLDMGPGRANREGRRRMR